MTANSVCFRWLSHHKSLLEQKGFPRVLPYPAQACFKFGDGRTGNVCFAADITVGIAGAKGAFTAFALDADIPNLLCKGALGALAGQLDFAWNALTLGSRGIKIPLEVSAMGHYILSVADFPGAIASPAAGSHFSASFLEWGPPRERPNLENGGICLPFTDEGLCSFAPPRVFAACKAATLGDASDGNHSDPKKIIEKLHVKWGHASAQQIKRVLVDAEGDNLSLLRHVEEVVNQCDVCKAFDKAPHTPIAGTSTVAVFNEKLQVDLLFLGDLIVLRIMDVFSKCSILTPVRPKNPLEVWDASVACWIGISGPPQSYSDGRRR